jgi:hypothetical protein
MDDDKKPMPVDGSDSERNMPDDNGELASRRDADSGGLPNAGESGGGAYPNPHSGKDGADYEGGQSGGRGYYGEGQLGEDDSLGGNDNAGSRDE